MCGGVDVNGDASTLCHRFNGAEGKWESMGNLDKGRYMATSGIIDLPESEVSIFKHL